MKKTINMMVLLPLFAWSLTAEVRAGGVIGNIVETACGGCGFGRTLDRANAEANKPFEHAVAIAADSVLPGSGVVLETGWQAQQFVQNVGMSQSMTGGRYALGNYCQLDNGGVIGPGVSLPVGSPCFDNYGNNGLIIN